MNASRDHVTRHRLSTDEYRRMAEHGILAPDARVELIEGEIVDMPPIGSSHNGVVNHLNRLFTDAVGATAIVQVQGSVELPRHSQPQPDIALLRPRADFYKRTLPQPEDVILLVEVADSTLVYDRDVKAPLYAGFRIPEYWLVDAGGERVTVFRAPADGGWTVREELVELRGVAPALLPDAPLDLAALFRA